MRRARAGSTCRHSPTARSWMRLDADRELNSQDLLAHLARKSLALADKVTDGAERYSLVETVRD
jgi:hypothetical protein